MSDNSGEEKPKEPEPEQPGKKFFISHINSYTGRCLNEELKNKHLVREEFAAHTFSGTLETGKNHIYSMQSPVVPQDIEKVVKMERTRDFRDTILESDVIIYDLMTNDYEEVDYVIKTLKTSKLTTQKTLVILSHVMTWFNTPPKFEKEPVEGEEPDPEEAEEPEEDEDEVPAEDDDPDKPKPPKVVFYKESDNHMRVPHERFFKHKNLETLALSAPKTQPLLKVHILCCGIRYGHGEGIFYDHFRSAWKQSPAKLPIVGAGDNLIPTLHIRDLSRCVKKLIDDNIDKPYLFAVDKTKKPTQKRLIEAISKGIGTGEVRNFEEQDISDSIIWKDFLRMNIKMRSSDVFKDKTPPEDVDVEDEKAMEPFKFKWHCQKGIIENALKLNIEFNEARELEPVKILITGPPASGKTFYSNKISQFYNIPRVHAAEFAEEAYKLSNLDEEVIAENELASKIKEKLDALKEDVIAKLTEENEAVEDYEPPEKEKIHVRVPDEFIYELMLKRINENDCRNRGYILDGFPRSYKDCNYVFMKKLPKYDPDTGDLIEEEEPELEEGQEKSFEGYVKEDSIFPKSVIVLEQKDEFLIRRIKELSETQIASQSNFNVSDVTRRLKVYRSLNESKVADPSVHQFFADHSVKLFKKDAALDPESLMFALKIYVERMGAPNNFLSQTESSEAKRRILVQKDIIEQTQIAQMRVRMEDGVEKELKKQKEKHTKDNLQAIREDQKEKLDSKSQPIRQYLNDNLVPILTDGLIDICKLQPDDPVDALAEYLFKRSLDVPYPDPCSYIE